MGEVTDQTAQPTPTFSNLSTSELSPIKDVAEKREALVQQKVLLIDRACHKNDIDALIGLATQEAGFLNDDLRCRAWPILIGSPCGQGVQDNVEPVASWHDLPPHRDEEQVQLDVNRAFVYYPIGESDKDIEDRKSSLSNLIIQVLREHPMLCYFQGYHDIVQVLLLVIGKELSPATISRVSLLRVRDYMLPSLGPSLRHLQIIPSLLRSADVELGRRLSHTQPYFALAATLTLYAHDIQEYSDIARLYDFILAHEPVMTIYLFTAIVMSRREELLQIPVDEPEMLHFTLSKLPQPLNLEVLITKATQLFSAYPPEKLPQFAWWKISSHSVLKTSRELNKKQSLEEGESLFAKQARELRREELQTKALKLIRKHRVPAISLTLALVVGAVSVWMARNGHDKVLWSALTKVKGSVDPRR